MDKLTTALLKALGIISIWCAIIIILFVCLYFTVMAFSTSVPLGLVALFVDAVIVATMYYYVEDGKPDSGDG